MITKSQRPLAIVLVCAFIAALIFILRQQPWVSDRIATSQHTSDTDLSILGDSSPTTQIKSQICSPPVGHTSQVNTEHCSGTSADKISSDQAKMTTLPLERSATSPMLSTVDVNARTALTVVPLAKVIPSKSRMREEVRSNPHRTPVALLNFSIELGDRVDAAAESEGSATRFFPELESCLLDPKLKGRQSVQALCLLNAKRLTDKYPSLHSKYTALTNATDPSVVALTEKAIR